MEVGNEKHFYLDSKMEKPYSYIELTMSKKKNMHNKYIKEFSGSKTNLALDYADRETLKDFGWQKYHSNGDKYERADGIELVMFAHFHRSKEGFQEEHPIFEVYVTHWLAANKDRYDEDVFEILINRYGPVEGEQMIAPHMSYWE